MFSRPGGTQEDLEENASEGFGPVCSARSLRMVQGEVSGTEPDGLGRPDGYLNFWLSEKAKLEWKFLQTGIV